VDLAQRRGEARETVEQAEHPQAPVAQRLRDGEREIGRAPPHHGGQIRSRDHDHRARQTLAPEALEKAGELAAALADQAEHQGIGLAVARQHREQGRLAHAGAGEDAHALALAARREQVEGAHAQIQPPAQVAAAMGRDRRRLDPVGHRPAWQGRPAIQRPCEGVQHATAPCFGRANPVLIARHADPRADADAVDAVERQQMHPGLVDRHNFGEQCSPAAAILV
jgi:hypothetical protein